MPVRAWRGAQSVRFADKQCCVPAGAIDLDEISRPEILDLGRIGGTESGLPEQNVRGSVRTETEHADGR
jgi:hypothetical protein